MFSSILLGTGEYCFSAHVNRFTFNIADKKEVIFM